MAADNNIDDLIAFLDGSAKKGVGHINVDTDELSDKNVSVETV